MTPDPDRSLVRSNAMRRIRPEIRIQLEPFRAKAPVWAAMHDRERLRDLVVRANASYQAYKKFRRGLAQVLAMPMKKPEV